MQVVVIFLTFLKSFNDFFFKIRRLIFAPFYWVFFPLPNPKQAVSIRTLITEDRGHQIQKLSSPRTMVPKPPRIFGSLSGEYFKSRKDAVDVFGFELTNGRVFHDGNVITSEGQLIAETSHISSESAPKPLAGLVGLPRLRHFPGRLGVFAAPMASRYFHWLLETLPRFYLLKEMQVDSFYVYGKHSFIRESLELIGLGADQILPPRKYAHWSADTLVGVTPLANSGSVSEETINFLRSLVKEKMKTSDSARRIYISRNDARYRGVRNERALLAQLDHYGFERVLLSRLSFSEQIRLFASAEVVIAPHGAGLANLVFSPPGCTVIEFMPENYVNACFWSLSEACGHHYYCIGGVKESGTHNLMNLDLKILDTVCKQSLGRK